MRTGVIVEDLLANRPAAGRRGRMFHATDTAEVFLDTGSVWAAMGGSTGGSTTFVGVRAYKSVEQSVNNNAVTALTFDLESFDSHGFHDNVTNPARFTVPAGQAGTYLATCGTQWAMNETGFRRLFIIKNGSGTLATQIAPVAGPISHSMQIHGLMELAEGDYIDFRGEQNSGAALNVHALPSTFGALIKQGA